MDHDGQKHDVAMEPGDILYVTYRHREPDIT